MGGGQGVRVCTCGAVPCVGTPGTFTRQPSREGRWRDFLAVAVFVFWVLRDLVLAPNGCYPWFLNFILFFLWCSLCKMTTAGRKAANIRLYITEVLALGEGKTKQPQPAFLRARPGRREHFVDLAGRPGAGGGGAGAKGRSL